MSVFTVLVNGVVEHCPKIAKVQGAGVRRGIAFGKVIVESCQPCLVYFVKDIAMTFAYKCFNVFESALVGKAR